MFKFRSFFIRQGWLWVLFQWDLCEQKVPGTGKGMRFYPSCKPTSSSVTVSQVGRKHRTCGWETEDLVTAWKTTWASCSYWFCCPQKLWGNAEVYVIHGASQVALENPPASAGGIRGAVSIPGSAGRRHDNPLQSYCLENPVDRGACWATVTGLQRVGYD